MLFSRLSWTSFVAQLLLLQADMGPVIVAVPVRDEAERIADCLLALAAQRGEQADAIVVFVNDTTDETVSVLSELIPALSIPIHVVEHSFAPGQASAGHARHLAMHHAADLARKRGILLTTDADGRVAPDWISANLNEIQRGADAVAGRADIDSFEARAIPAKLHEDDAKECAYADCLDEIASLLDPDPFDPWPRHNDHSGASICVTLDAYHRAGGVPYLALGEDRAFFDALRRVDARIRHAPDVKVSVSGRIVGRAAGGMADTIRRRLTAMDLFLDEKLEPAALAVRRVRLRRDVRTLFRNLDRRRGEARSLASQLGMPTDELLELCRTASFGAAWAEIEHRSPFLTRIRVPTADLARESAFAVKIRHAARASNALPLRTPAGLSTIRAYAEE